MSLNFDFGTLFNGKVKTGVVQLINDLWIDYYSKTSPSHAHANYFRTFPCKEAVIEYMVKMDDGLSTLVMGLAFESVGVKVEYRDLYGRMYLDFVGQDLDKKGLTECPFVLQDNDLLDSAFNSKSLSKEDVYKLYVKDDWMSKVLLRTFLHYVGVMIPSCDFRDEILSVTYPDLEDCSHGDKALFDWQKGWSEWVMKAFPPNGVFDLIPKIK